MLGILIKKQMTELFRSFFVDNRTNKAFSKGRVIGSVVIFGILIVGLVGGMFAMLSFALAGVLYETGMSWLYFTIMGLVAVLIGLFGSVFNTYATLYLARDNELLLSMPITPRDIILSRLISVYLMGLLYGGAVLVPASVVYMIVTPFRVGVLIGCILLILIVSLITLLLSCVLGLAVAAIASKLKNKSFITVIVSLVFIGAYYYVYFRMQTIITALLNNAAAWGGTIRDKAYPLYLFGRMGEGDPLALLIYGGATVALCLLAYLVMSKTFLRMALAKGAVARGVYREQGRGTRSVPAALLAREFKRFTSSATYMLNCALGVVITPAVGVLLLVRMPALQAMLTEIFNTDSIGAALPAFVGLLMFIMTMTNTAAATISMEGKTLWVLRTLPVTPRQILTAKLTVQLLLSGIPALVYCILTAIALFPITHPDPLSAVLYFVAPQVFNVLYAFFCLSQGLRHVILDWTNETAAVKNNLACLITIFGGWGIAFADIAVGIALAILVSPAVGLAAVTLLTAGIACLFLLALVKRDVKRFGELN